MHRLTFNVTSDVSRSSRAQLHGFQEPRFAAIVSRTSKVAVKRRGEVTREGNPRRRMEESDRIDSTRDLSRMSRNVISTRWPPRSNLTPPLAPVGAIFLLCIAVWSSFPSGLQHWRLIAHTYALSSECAYHAYSCVVRGSVSAILAERKQKHFLSLESTKWKGPSGRVVGSSEMRARVC